MKEIDIQIKFNRIFFLGGGRKEILIGNKGIRIYIVSITISKIIQKTILSFGFNLELLRLI